MQHDDTIASAMIAVMATIAPEEGELPVACAGETLIAVGFVP